MNIVECWKSGSYDCVAASESCNTLFGIEDRKYQSQLNFSQKLCVCQKCMTTFALYSHQLARYWSSYLIYIFRLWICNLSFFFYTACCGLYFIRCFCLWPAVLYIFWNCLFFITLQEKIDAVTVEGVENVGEEDWIKIKTEQHYIQLVRTVKVEQEVSVLFWK
jgi:hypothetical protein